MFLDKGKKKHKKRTKMALKKTSVCIVNCSTGTTDLNTIPVEELSHINKIQAMARGTYIWDLIK